ncbi:MAG: tRNA pseudouridine(13) synthase TruD [Campylobacterota bacterium]|nr:tRNA pseudouridine(13) synthase TruD [Campylobacterota bacterium]
MIKQYYLNHSQIDVYFKQSKDDFVVTEIPLYEFTGEGEHLVLKMRKKDLTTWDALEIIAKAVGCRSRDIGYAGLKDKNAMTVQYISIHRQYEEKIDKLSHPQIKFLEKTYHNNKIKTGHLKGNKFFIRLKRVQPMDKMKIESALEQIATFGIPNYFGFQRFGNYGDNYLKGKDIIDGKLKEKNRKLKQMYINAYQSYLFNSWLSKRVEISKLINGFKANEIASKVGLDENEIKEIQKQEHPFKILKGDLFNHYPYGRLFYVEDVEEEAQKFYNRDRVPTGLLSGSKTKFAIDDALKFEEEFIENTKENGARRFAWVFPSEIQSEYKEIKAWFELSFELPKGSYATEVISELLHIDLKN